MFGRSKIATLLGEFLGTAALTLVVLSVSRSSIGLPYFVALAVGVVIPVLVFVFSNSQTGAHLNPAITLGLWTIRKIKSLDAVMYIALQLLGAYLAYLLFTYFVGASLPAATNEFSGRVLVAEAAGTFVLAFAWAAAWYRGYKHLSFGAVVGLGYALGIIVASSAASGFLNPALALGNRYWIWSTYVLGPILGALIGFNLYSLLFADPEKVTAAAAAPARVTRTVKTAKVAAKKPAKRTTRAKK